MDQFGPHLVHLGGLLRPVESAKPWDTICSYRRKPLHQAEDAGRNYSMVYTLRRYPFAVGVDLKRPGLGPHVVHFGGFRARACGVRGRAARSCQQLTIRCRQGASCEGVTPSAAPGCAKSSAAHDRHRRCGETAKVGKCGLGLLTQCRVERDDLGGLTRLYGHLGQLSR